jgi:hypothetical protein
MILFNCLRIIYKDVFADGSIADTPLSKHGAEHQIAGADRFAFDRKRRKRINIFRLSLVQKQIANQYFASIAFKSLLTPATIAPTDAFALVNGIPAVLPTET